MADGQRAEEIYEKLQYIRSSFIQENMRQSPYFGGFANTSFNTTTLPGRLFSGYTSGFASASSGYTSSILSDTTAANLKSRVLYRANNAANDYAAIPSKTGDAATITDTLPMAAYTDINLSKFLTDGSALAQELDKIVLAYSVLEDYNYTQFQSGTSTLHLSKYKVSGTRSAVDFTYDAATKMYNPAINDGTPRLDRVIGDLAQTGIASTQNIPVGTFNDPKNNIKMYRDTSVLPPGGSTDPVLSIAPAILKGTDAVSPVMPMPVPATGTSFTLRVTGKVKLVAAAPTTGTPSFAVYLNRGGVMTRIGAPVTGITASTDAATWTDFVLQSEAISSIDRSVGLTLVFTHNASAIRLLLTDFKVETQAANASDAGVSGSPFTSDTDLFVVRRMLLLYKLMANFYIAMRVYDLTTQGSENTNAVNLLSLTFQNIAALNRNVIRAAAQADQSDSIQAIAKEVNSRVRQFRELGQGINKLDATVRDRKVDLRDRINRLEEGKKSEKRTSSYAIATIVVVAIMLAAIAVVIVAPTTPLIKIAGTAAVLLAGAIFTLAIRRAYDGNVTEAFNTGNGNAVWSLPMYPVGVTASTKAAAMTTYENAFMKEVSEYLSHTTNLALLLQNYQAYGNINQSMMKEYKYFTDAAENISNQNYKIENSISLVRLDQVSKRAQMTLALTILIIVAAAAFSVSVVAPRYPGLTPVIVVVACVLLAIAFFLYILDTNARVRTDGQKRYWQQPNLNELK